MWQQWGARDKGIRRRVHDMGQRHVENVSPESRLLTGVKRGTKQLTVYHPSSISDEVINQQMANIAATNGKAAYWKLSAACAALPVAFAVDTLAVIGLPPMLTGYTGMCLLVECGILKADQQVVYKRHAHAAWYSTKFFCVAQTAMTRGFSVLHNLQCQHCILLHSACEFVFWLKGRNTWFEAQLWHYMSHMSVGYLSYKHYKGAAGASTLKKLGQSSSSQQPLAAGLTSQQQPPNDASLGEGYTGFASQSPESTDPTQPSSGMPSGQSTFPSQSGTYPAGNPLPTHQGLPGSAVPSDSNPMTYQTMLDSLPSSGNDAGQGSASNPVQYPKIETGGMAEQHPHPSPGVAPTSMGAQPGTGCSPLWPHLQRWACLCFHCVKKRASARLTGVPCLKAVSCACRWCAEQQLWSSHCPSSHSRHRLHTTPHVG